MADDNFFGGLQSGFQDLIPNRITYAPPEQIKAIRGMGEEMRRQKRAPGPFGPANALDTVLGGILGGYMERRAGELERGALEKGAAASTFGEDNSASTSNASGNSSGGDSAPVSQPSGSDQSASTPGGGDTAMAASGETPSWTTHAANMSSEYETGAKDPLAGLRNISPDTSNPDGSPSYSYGNFGLNSKSGNPAWDFWRDHGAELGLTARPGTAEANQQWLAGVSNPEMAPKFRAAEIDWYNKNIAAKVPDKLKDAKVPDSIAKDPRVLSWFADRSIQHGIDSIGGRHQDRLQNAVTLSGGDPQKFINIMSTADKGNIGGDFQSRLKDARTPEERQQLVTGLINRVSRRQGGALGYSPSAPGATPSAAPSPGAIAPMVNALAGIGGQPTPAASVPGASIAANPNAPGSFDTPASPNMMGTLRGVGAPPAGGLASDQQALVAAMRGGPGESAIPPGAPPAAPPGAPMAPPGGGAPGPAAMTQAIAGPQGPAGGAGARIPPTLPMSSLPSDAQIQTQMASGRPEFIARAKELSDYKMKALTPQQITTPDGINWIGTPYTGYTKSPIPGMPQFIKTDVEYPGIYKGQQLSTAGTAPGGGFALNPVPMNPPAGAPAAAPGAGGIPPMPSTSDIPGMAAWGSQVMAARKAAEVGAEEQTKGLIKPINEAVEKASNAPRVLQSLDIMKDAYRKGDVSGGPMGKWLLEAKGALNQLGIETKGLTEGNIIEKISTGLSFDMARELSARPAASEVIMGLRANPGLLMNNKASLYLIDIRRQQVKQDMELGKIASEIKNPSQWLATRDQYYKDNPLTSPLTGKPIAQKGVDSQRELSALSAATGVKLKEPAAAGAAGGGAPWKAFQGGGQAAAQPAQPAQAAQAAPPMTQDLNTLMASPGNPAALREFERKYNLPQGAGSAYLQKHMQSAYRPGAMGAGQ